MKNKAVSSIQSSYVMIMTLYALLAAVFVDNARGEENSNIINNVGKDNKASAQELVENPCKSPCPSNAEMCIQMCV